MRWRRRAASSGPRSRKTADPPLPTSPSASLPLPLRPALRPALRPSLPTDSQ
jgi:hypothetical protein